LQRIDVSLWRVINRQTSCDKTVIL